MKNYETMRREQMFEQIFSTIDGSAFGEKYLKDRKTISELQSKVVEAIRDSGLSVSETIGFFQYMTDFVIKSQAYLQ